MKLLSNADFKMSAEEEEEEEFTCRKVWHLEEGWRTLANLFWFWFSSSFFNSLAQMQGPVGERSCYTGPAAQSVCPDEPMTQRKPKPKSPNQRTDALLVSNEFQWQMQLQNLKEVFKNLLDISGLILSKPRSWCFYSIYYTWTVKSKPKKGTSIHRIK